jgi:lactate 2-monooxygenase
MSREHPGSLKGNLRSGEPWAAVEAFLDIYSNPGLSWDHIATLRRRTSLPIVLKGILHPDDARRAIELGIDVMIVSNHGGRQVTMRLPPSMHSFQSGRRLDRSRRSCSTAASGPALMC